MSAAPVEVLYGDDHPTLVGTAHFTRQRGRISTTFIYDTEYLSGNGIPIDPALPLVSGAQHQNGLVRAFADSAPDRWGRGLIDNAERARARDEGRAPRISRATSSLSSWGDRARTHGIPAREITMMGDAVTPRLDAVSRLVT